MRSILCLSAAAVLLSGCALLPSKVTPLKLAVATPSSPAPKFYTRQLFDNLTAVAARRDQYIDDYNRLSDEQTFREGAILATSVGLSSTAIFRGDANSLKWAGALVGLATFYDKAVPISSRITAAQTAVNSFNALIGVGNPILTYDLDDDKANFESADADLEGELAAADVASAQDKPYAPKACPTAPAAQLDCVKGQLAEAASIQSDVSALKASITAGKAVLVNAKAAIDALKSVPTTVSSTAGLIDIVGQKGVARSFDPSIATGFVAASPPKTPAATPPTPAAAHAAAPGGPPGPPTAAQENAKLKQKIDVAQQLLNRVDYPGFVAQIKATAPASAPPASGTPAATKGGS